MGLLEDMKAQLDRIEVRLAKCEAPSVSGWVGPRQSPLGPKAHCKAARELRDQGDPRVYVKGKKHLIMPEAIRELMLANMSKAQPANSTDGADDDVFYADLVKEVGGS